MRIVEIGDGGREDGVEELSDGQELLPEEEDGQGDLSSAVSFVTARLSLSSSSSSSSLPSLPPSPSYTPWHQRDIIGGQDIEERASLGWLPFTLAEWEATVAVGSSSAGLLDDHPSGQTMGIPYIGPSRPLRPSEVRIAVRLLRTDGYGGGRFSWNPWRRKVGCVNNKADCYKALRHAIKFDGVKSAELSKTTGIVTITAVVADPLHIVNTLHRKMGWLELIEILPG